MGVAERVLAQLVEIGENRFHAGARLAVNRDGVEVWSKSPNAAAWSLLGVFGLVCVTNAPGHSSTQGSAVTDCAAAYKQITEWLRTAGAGWDCDYQTAVSVLRLNLGIKDGSSQHASVPLGPEPVPTLPPGALF